MILGVSLKISQINLSAEGVNTYLDVIPYNEYTGEVQKTLDVKEIGASWAAKKKVRPKSKHPWR